MVLTAAAVALFTKLLMMEHESTDQERRERKIKNSHPDQGKVRMLSREEWEEVQEVRPRTPFESKLARPHARIRTGEPVRLEDVKDWATDVIADAFTRVEESTKFCLQTVCGIFISTFFLSPIFISTRNFLKS